MAAGKLTPKQTLFVKEYLVDLNATQAAIRSGYSAKTAFSIGVENLSKPLIQQALQAAMNKRADKVELTADQVLKDIRTIKERCMQGVEVLTKTGEPTGEWKFDATNALKACELEGKHLKLFTDKVEHTGEVDIKILLPEDMEK